jgi:chemotaxis protein histidine kinase CheA
LGELFRIIHTVRGEAQSFELTELAELLSGLEARLAELRAQDHRDGAIPFASARSDLEAGITSAIVFVEQSTELFVEASPSGRAALDNVLVPKRDITRLVELCAGRSDDMALAVARLASRPFGDCVASLLEQASAWAEKEHKRVRVEVDGREARVPPGLADVLGGVLTHLVRNAIAHGIEPTDERARLGKSPIGSIELVCRSLDDSSTVLFVDDDGRGIADNEVLTSAANARLPLQNLAGRGGSTRLEVSDLAGYGVGLPAVEADLASVGYAVSVAQRAGGGTRFEIRPQPQSAS